MKIVGNVFIAFMVFLLLFILVTAILGSWIVGTKLLYGAYFFVYANVGKMVLLLGILFPFLIRNRLKELPAYSFKIINIFWLTIAFALIPLFFNVAGSLLAQFPSPQLLYLITTHIILLSIPFFLLLGVFGHKFMGQFIRVYYKELGICLALSIVLYLGIFQVWKLWPFFSKGVLTAVSLVFTLNFQTRVIPPTTLIVNNFAVRIEQACSGLDSLFMFSALYILIGIIDKNILNLRKYFFFYFPTALCLYLINILRVYLIILVGVLYSPQFALKLFHTYLGMVLFILFFLLFLKFVYPRLKK